MTISTHTGTTGREAKYDRWTEAQTEQNEHLAKVSQRDRFEPLPLPLSPEWYDERDRLIEISHAARLAKEDLGSLCYSLIQLRDKAVNQARSDVVLAVQPFVDKYQDLLVVAREADKAANRDFVAFVMGVK